MSNGEPRHKFFNQHEMTDALKFMESLRVMQRECDEAHSVGFITFCSENPDSVTKMGVDVTGPDYDWKKRRD
jgi:hypothetical protein